MSHIKCVNVGCRVKREDLSQIVAGEIQGQEAGHHHGPVLSRNTICLNKLESAHTIYNYVFL